MDIRSTIEKLTQNDHLVAKCTLVRAELTKKGINLDTEELFTLSLIAPLISVAMADGEISFFEKSYINTWLNTGNYPKFLNKITNITETWRKIESDMLDFSKATFRQIGNSEFIKNELINIASVDGIISTPANFSLLAICLVGGLGMGGYMYLKEIGALPFDGSVSEAEKHQINKICSILDIPNAFDEVSCIKLCETYEDNTAIISAITIET